VLPHRPTIAQIVILLDQTPVKLLSGSPSDLIQLDGLKVD
jgi:hypothetical protein